MNIQIFGKAKCFDTKKAERYFKERRIKFQMIDVAKYGMSKGEYNSVKSAVGGYDNLVDKECKLYEELFMAYLAGSINFLGIEETVFETVEKMESTISRLDLTIDNICQTDKDARIYADELIKGKIK